MWWWWSWGGECIDFNDKILKRIEFDDVVGVVVVVGGGVENELKL